MRPVLLLESAGQDRGLRAQAVRRHRLQVAGPPLGARRRGPAVDVHNAPVPEAHEVVDRHGDAAAVVDAHDIDAGAGQRAGDRDDGDLGGQHAQTGGAERGGDHDQRLAAVAQKGLGGPPVIDRSDHGGQHQLVPAGLRGRVQAVDDLGVKGLVHPEGDPDEPRARRSQGARPLVGSVAQARGDRLDPAPSLLRGPGGVPHDDRDQGDRAVGLAGDIDERHLPGAPP